MRELIGSRSPDAAIEAACVGTSLNRFVLVILLALVPGSGLLGACTNSATSDDEMDTAASDSAKPITTMNAEQHREVLFRKLDSIESQVRDPSVSLNTIGNSLENFRDTITAFCGAQRAAQTTPVDDTISTGSGVKAPTQLVTLPQPGAETPAAEAATERERRMEATLKTHLPGPPLPGQTSLSEASCGQVLMKLQSMDSKISAHSLDRGVALTELQAMRELVLQIEPAHH